MWLDVDVTMAPLKNNYFEIALFSFIKLLRTLKTALRKQRCQFLYVVKVSVVNSYTHLENLLVWTADFFFQHKSEPSSVSSDVCHRNSVFVFLLLPSSRLVFEKKIASIHPFDLTVRKILHPFTRSTLPFEKIASVHPFDFTVRKNVASVQPTFRMACLAVCYPFACRAFGRSDNA